MWKDTTLLLIYKAKQMEIAFWGGEGSPTSISDIIF